MCPTPSGTADASANAPAHAPAHAQTLLLHDEVLRIQASRLLMCVLPCMAEAQSAALLADLLHAHRAQAEALLVSYLRGFLHTLTHPTVQAKAAVSNPSGLQGLLSPHELRVLQLLAQGHTRPQIAAALVISINTVKTQLNHIYRKLNVNRRADAIATAHQLGLLG